MILSPSDLRRQTGYVRASAQARWLRQHGWRFTVNALGEPIVYIAEANRHQVGGKAASTQEPNWDAMNGQKKKAG